MWSQSVMSMMNWAFQKMLNHKTKCVPGDLLDFIKFSFGALFTPGLEFLITPRGDTHLDIAWIMEIWSSTYNLIELDLHPSQDWGEIRSSSSQMNDLVTGARNWTGTHPCCLGNVFHEMKFSFFPALFSTSILSSDTSLINEQQLKFLKIIERLKSHSSDVNWICTPVWSVILLPMQ